jgi:flagellar basal body rod protein FlgB
MSIIKTDMAKAREIHKTNIRNARTPKLAELDIEFQKALETGASTTDIVAKKQALRDAPADSGIAAAADEAALKAQWKTDILGSSPYS